jgi:hypothetical protein
MGQEKSLLPYFWNSESVIDKRLEEDLCVILEKKEKQMAVFFFLLALGFELRAHPCLAGALTA